ncbi:MAG: hypothetical protein J6P64_04795 [Bacteroidales bacterium]|nr:hypothetical protein [Bacteroidales bacterium]
MDIERIIELTLITLYVAFYFGMPAVAKRIYDPDRRRSVINKLNVVYLFILLGLVCFVVRDFIIYDLAGDYITSRLGLVIIAVVMFVYTTFVKKKQWFEE